MARPTASPLERQLARVRRSLFLQSFLELLAWGWLVALVMAVGWILAQPYLLVRLVESSRSHLVYIDNQD